MSSITYTSDMLMNLLAARHVDDVFIGECKNGPTWSAAHRRLDAWVLRTTWRPWTTIGYEVKVSRADFRQDEKWSEYLPYVHQFFFVCPPGVIRLDELPPGVGLIWGNPSGTKLHVKYMPERHEPNADKLCKLMSYVLMNRLKQTDGCSPPIPRSVEYCARLRADVEAANERKGLACFVAQHVRERMYEADEKLKEAKEMVCEVWEFEQGLAERGIEWKPSAKCWGVSGALSQAEQLAGLVARGVPRRMRELAKDLVEASDMLDIKKEHEREE